MTLDLSVESWLQPCLERAAHMKSRTSKQWKLTLKMPAFKSIRRGKKWFRRYCWVSFAGCHTLFSLFFLHHICRTDSTQSDSARQGICISTKGVSYTNDALVSIPTALSMLTKSVLLIHSNTFHFLYLLNNKSCLLFTYYNFHYEAALQETLCKTKPDERKLKRFS